MYHILEEICHNYIAQAAFWGWFSAQAIKFLWQLVRYRTLRFERLVGSGGFPSSHTSFVISTTAALYFKNNGITDIFVVALVFSIVVMYDASGVRSSSWSTSTNIESNCGVFLVNEIFLLF